MDLNLKTNEQLAIFFATIINGVADRAADRAIDRFLNEKTKPQEQPDSCNKEQALKFLNDQGYKISESQLYKKTAAKEIPFKSFGRQLVFSRKELLFWAESQIVDNNNSSAIEQSLAKSARRRKGGRDAKA